jgi:hypothetical protein
MIPFPKGEHMNQERALEETERVSDRSFQGAEKESVHAKGPASEMLTFGWVILVAGVIYTIIAFNLKATVTSTSAFSVGSEIYNTGLMDERRNHLSVAELIALSGVIFIGFGARQKKATS